ncbi:MAG: hypothetical protein BGP01_14590 [Paludibacter sp. 47-17]|nr:MAG: hypothetical protein BGP01_14590 [Paludibacter sp. 47-17]
MKRQLLFLALLCGLYLQAQGLFTDDFTSAALSTQWTAVSPNPSGVIQLVDGQLFLRASALNGGSDLYSGSNFNAPRVIQLTNDANAAWTVTTRLSFNPTHTYQSAGIGLLMGSDVNEPAAYMRFIELKFSHDEGGRLIGGPQKTLPYTESVVYMRCARSADSIRVWISPTNADWISLGAIASVGVYGIGLHCIRQPWDGNTDTDSEAWFDFFQVGREGGEEPGGDETRLPFVFHRSFDDQSESYVSFFKMNDRGTYTAIAGRYGQFLPERTVSVEEFDRSGNLVSSKVIGRRPAGNGVGDFNCATADFESDGSMYVLLNNYIPGQEWNSVMKLNASGDSVWEVMVSEKWQWSAIVMPLLKTYPSGGFVVAGSTNGFPSKPRVNRYSGSGDLLWSQDVFTNDYGYNKFQAVTVNGSGSIFVGGMVHHNLNNRQSTIIAKLNAEGKPDWEKVYYSGYLTSGDSLVGEITSLLPTADGGCIAGGFESEKGSLGGWAMLRKLSASGETEWIQRYFYTGGWQDAKVIGLAQLPSSNHFIAYVHRDWGSTGAGATLMECDENGDTLWTQVDYDYRVELSGVDAGGNVLLRASAPYAPLNWNMQRFYLRTTPEGLYRRPELIYPFDGYDNILTQPRFEWRRTGHIHTTAHLQVATDSAFSHLIAERTGIQGTTCDQLKLPAGTACYYRVREVGVKGFAGPWSAPLSFTTEKGTLVEELAGENVQVMTDERSGAIKVMLASGQGRVRLLITDMAGRMIRRADTSAGEYIIEGLDTGIYLLRIVSRDEPMVSCKVRVM